MQEPEVAKLMAELYFDESVARTVLLEFGYPATLLPVFNTAATFWAAVVLQLEHGVCGEDGIRKLVAVTAEIYPGNKKIQVMRTNQSNAPESHPPPARSAFVSYSQKDERYRQQLDVSTAQIRRDNLISVWHDRMILPGQPWNREIDKNLESVSIFLLLVSPDFLASDYAYSREALRALERHKSGSATVVPIILRPTDWRSTPLGSLEALPSKGRPVSNWSNRDQAWLDVVQGLRRLVTS